MEFPDKFYNVLKWIVMIFLPAANTFVWMLSETLHFDSSTICGIISAVTVFLGSLIGVSTASYNKSKKKKKD